MIRLEEILLWNLHEKNKNDVSFNRIRVVDATNKKTM